MVALVAVDAAVYAIDKPYSYLIPPEMDARPGMRVIVPFGRGNRRSEGIVLEVREDVSTGLKSIERVLDQEPIVTAEFIRMAAFLRERYFCTFYDAIKTMLPAGLWFEKNEELLRTDKDASSIRKKPESTECKILQLVDEHGGAVNLDTVKTQFTPSERFEEALQRLLKNGYLRSNLDYTRRIKDKHDLIVSLAISAEEALSYAENKKRSAPLQYEAIKLLSTVGSGSAKEVSYLTGANTAVLRRLEKAGIVSFSKQEVSRSKLPNSVKPAEPLMLNAEQQAVYDALYPKIGSEQPGTALLYGVTGSGKTAVYIQLINHALENQQGAILLVPEISLTPQLISLLMSHFGETVAVLHSALRVSERYDEWKRIKQGRAKVVVGTRSAVFAPVQNLGLLVLDEEQEHTYKSENNPRYHAREVALYRGAKEHALVVLGSATPSVETMYLARSGVYGLFKLTNRYNGNNLPHVQIVDLKQEIRNGNSMGISQPLLASIENTDNRHEQSILFLNRRGAGRCMICVDCGNVPTCPRCSVSLTYHQANGRRMCHYCGWTEPADTQCNVCGGPLKIVGTGTQKIEAELSQLLPTTPVLRMDADTVTISNNHEAILEKFQTERIPVLIGTQMVTKGLNFENVTLVGVVDADMSLYVNHYRAAETTFSMLTQVIGRSGRGNKPGTAIIQTMTPEHAVIRMAAAQDYDAFYNMEIEIRRLQGCPPFCDLFTVQFSGLYEEQVLHGAWDFRHALEAMLKRPEYAEQALEILGPSPAAIAKINHAYRYRLTIKCENTKQFRLLLAHLLKTFTKEQKHKGVSAYADINSYE